MVTTCELDKVCDYTGEFKRQAATDPSIPDALYTYDNDKRCILIVTDKSGLERFEKEQENLNFEDDFLSIKGRAVKRESLQHWSKSSFCNDSDMALFMESIDPVFIMYHERP